MKWQKIIEQAIAKHIRLDMSMRLINFAHQRRVNRWDLMNEQPWLYLWLSCFVPVFEADENFIKYCAEEMGK